MRFYVGVTDDNWFSFLAARNPDEVNFWRPGGSTNFKAIEPGAPFLFKLHSPNNYIVGGGFFLQHSFLPVSLAWESFGEKNGRADYFAFREAIRQYRAKKGSVEPDPQIGCTLLTLPFFFPRDQWIPVPEGWGKSIVQGKTYDTTDTVGRHLWQEVQERLLFAQPETREFVPKLEEAPQYGAEYLTRGRLGQGGFRVMVTEAYHRRCAVTGEKTLPVLQAAHIRPFAENGPHAVYNGLLLRSDLHILYDKGYVTVTPDFRFEVSKRINQEWSNGKEYYALHGRPLAILPEKEEQRPAQELIEWHNERVWVG